MDRATSGKDPGTEDAAPVARALVCLRYGIGDVVMELPALRHLRAQWPNVHLTALGAHPATELIEGDPVVDALARIQGLGFQHWGDHGTESTRARAAQWIRDNRFQRVLDGCHAVAGMRQVLAELGVPASDTGSRVDAAARLEPGQGGGPAGRSILASAVVAWGLDEPSGDASPGLSIPASARATARAFQAQRGLSSGEWVGIAPVASSRLKRWPIERVRELVGRITTRRNRHVLVFGVASGDPAVQGLRAAGAPGRVEVVPTMHLQYTAALIARCRAFVSNDTGLMHIAAAVGTRTVALFGPTSPEVVLPGGAKAVGSARTCGYRPTDRLGPPRCIREDRCLVDDESCIADVGVDAVESALYDALDTRMPRVEGCENGLP